MTQTDLLEHGDRVEAKVQRATELRSILSIDGVTVRLSAPQEGWTKYRLLYEAGFLAPGRTLNVVINKWNQQLRCYQASLPLPDGRFTGKELDAPVIFIRDKCVKSKRNELLNIIYAEVSEGEFVRIEANELLEPMKAFPVGSRIPLLIGTSRKYTMMYDAEIDWEKTQFSTPRVPVMGRVVKALVIWVSPYGARCLLDNRVVGFMHKGSVLGTESDDRDLMEVLSLGDRVTVRVSGSKHEIHGTYPVDFSGKCDPVAQEPEEQAVVDLIDSEAERQFQSTEKFSRDRNFRWSVLEAYEETCCICGAKFVIGDCSTMEAAHVIPRSERGIDSPDNGLCLCPVHHWAFDKGLIAIDDQLVIRVADIARDVGDEGRWLAYLDGHSSYLENNSPVSRAALAWHMANVFVDGYLP